MKRLVFFVICLAFGAGCTWAAPAGAALFGIEPPEIDLGIISPGKVVHSSVVLKHSLKSLEWTLEHPEGWEVLENLKLSGGAPGGAENVVIALKFERLQEPGSAAFVRMVVFTAGAQAKYSRVMGIGRQKLLLPFKTGEETQHVGIQFDLMEKDIPVLNIEPNSVDFGAAEAGKHQNSQIRITNRGTKKLHWKISVPGSASGGGAGLFLTLQNEEARGKGSYFLPSRLEGMFQLTGNWTEKDGYPESAGPGSALNMNFTGSGAGLVVRRDAEAGSVNIYFDDEWVTEVDCRSGRRERLEIPVVQKKTEGPHRIRVIGSGGPVLVEGVRIFSAEVLNPPTGWLKVAPDAGDTTGETDYVNLRTQTETMEPGLYTGTVHVQSDGGDAVIDVSLRVTAAVAPKILNVYKYTRGLDTLFTSSPEREDQRMLGYYRKQGLSFRLFKESTPGTKRLYRWYHPGKGDHYYSSEPQGEKNLTGYIAEGSIGNIATSKLPATRELYRWYNPKTGLHLFTLDLKGEGYGRKGYRYEGIVGYVR